MKILYVTTVGKTMRFFESFIKELIEEGHQVDVATNEKNSEVPECYRKWGCSIYQIGFSRSPVSLDNIKACGELKRVVKNGNYDIVHCHTPNAAVVTRLVCRKFRKKKGMRVFYTAHGFHFYKGAPQLNWMLFYPVEKICSYFTDKLITINKEDYELANKKFKAKEVCYVPGVGIDLSKFDNVQVNRNARRREIGIPEDAIVLISVGELIERKNHKCILQALSRLDNEKIHYVIVGEGPTLSVLKTYAEEHMIEDRIHFLGYRKDIAELYSIADICCLPSIQEGLPVALMEGMASGLPVICSEIRGNIDLIDEKGGKMFAPYSDDDCRRALTEMLELENDMKQMGKMNKEKIKEYSIVKIIMKMKKIYESE